jgi:endoglucanase
MIAALTCTSAFGSSGWPLWESYASYFLEREGRIVDYDRASSTTSEGQAYALFFALVANDRSRFDRIFEWTQNNLARGALQARLPAWHWGKASSGRWQVLDPNSASDADLWIAYTLLQAGRLWKAAPLTEVGAGLAKRIADEETADVPDLGTILLPGKVGFHPQPDVYELNASYLPAQVVEGLASELRWGPWSQIADAVPRVLEGSSRHGLVLDWIAYRVGQGFATQPLPTPEPLASYDAIRVYLWAGTLAPKAPQRDEILQSMTGMREQLRKSTYPPTEIKADGEVKNARGNLGFGAAVVPFLVSIGELPIAEANLRRLDAEFDEKTGLYGTPARYYDQNLALFALGWLENRYSFDQQGRLVVNWRP